VLKKLRAVRREVNDALSSLGKNVENIIDSTDPKTQRDHYINWIARIRRLAQNIDTMPRWIFDLTVTAPLKSRWTEEEQLYYAGAYSIIEEKCTKHSVYFGLQGVDPGDAHAALAVLQDYHYPQGSDGGLTEVRKDFNNIDQRTENVAVEEFILLAKTRAGVLQKISGDNISEASLINILLGGLLDNFEPVVQQIKGWDPTRRTWAKVGARITEFAKSNNLRHLTAGGDHSGRDKTFALRDSHQNQNQARRSNQTHSPAGVNNSSRVIAEPGVRSSSGPWLGGMRDCQKWRYGLKGGPGCHFGENCRYNHPPGEGKLKPQRPREPREAKAHVANGQVHCAWCGSNQHYAAACPKRSRCPLSGRTRLT
jgi:hypothetical protein